MTVAKAAPPESTAAPAQAKLNAPTGGSFGHVSGHGDVSPDTPKFWVPNPPTAPLPPAAAANEVAVASPLPAPAAPADKSVIVPMPGAHNQADKVAELTSHIQKTGGDHISKLQVSLTGNRLAVRFSAPSQQEAQRLAQLMMTMPALAPYWLELKVDVPN
jgi:hypothetical protein